MALQWMLVCHGLVTLLVVVSFLCGQWPIFQGTFIEKIHHFITVGAYGYILWVYYLHLFFFPSLSLIFCYFSLLHRTHLLRTPRLDFHERSQNSSMPLPISFLRKMVIPQVPGGMAELVVAFPARFQECDHHLLLPTRLLRLLVNDCKKT